MRRVHYSYGYVWIDGIGMVANAAGVFRNRVHLIGEGVEEMREVMRQRYNRVTVDDPPEDVMRKGAKFLMGLCHSEGCDRVRECPLDHIACRGRLDMKTGVWWMAAKYMEEAATIVGQGYQIERAPKVVGALRALLGVVSLHMGAEGNAEAYGRIKYAANVLGFMIEDM